MNEILLEYYAGRPKELIKCEEYLADIIKDIKRDHASISPTRTRHVHRNSKSAQKLEETLANFFKVESVTIYWQSGKINAATLSPMAVMIPDYKAKYEAGQKSSLRMHIRIYENLVYKAGLTEAELLACILHEIGHNFYYCPIMVACEIFYVVATLPMGVIHKLIAKGLIKLNDFIEDAIKQHLPFVYNLMNTYMDIVSEINYFFKPVGVLAAMAKTLVGDGGRSALIALPKYGGEKGADSMAAKYGYGPELASGLHKMENPENMLATRMNDSMGAFGTIMSDLTILGVDLVAGMTLDPHPNNNQRAASMLKKLKNDLKTGDYPPAMKKDLEAEIKRMEEAYEAINDPRRGKDPSVRKAWYRFIDGMTKGHSDLREVFNFYYDSYNF